MTHPATIVRDDGFHVDDFHGPVVPLDEAHPASIALDVPGDSDAAALKDNMDARFIRIWFSGFADGRGFTLARQLRRLGFQVRLRAAGPLIADQYPLARKSGFDEVEPTPQILSRQPEAQWIARAPAPAGPARDYQSRLAALSVSA
ncbi:MAG: DUF934 domain-containing protein [Rhodobacteraceae bacterium]|nr:DUF934 domain-containing protein [Paracoccaceae bacterium]